MDISKALLSLAPGASWSMNNDDYDQIIWKSNDIEKPSKEAVDLEVARLRAEYEAKEYQRLRAAEYPNIKDQLDAIWKGGDAYEEMLSKVMSVKDKYPKPGD